MKKGPTNKTGDAKTLSLDLGTRDEEETLPLDIDGFEGPLHILLALARADKVDLRALSIVALADQYLAFVEAARALKLEIAADHLVMAAWLAYLKSRLLLPKPRPDDGDEPEPEALARALAFRLRRLEAMRRAGRALDEGDVLGRDVHQRGMPEGVRSLTTPEWEATLYDLLKAYGARRSRAAMARVRFPKPRVYALEAARERLEKMLGATVEWRRLDAFLPEMSEFGDEPPPRASLTASAFMAGLELARDGKAQLRQDALFGPLYLRGGKGRASSE